MTDLEIVSNNPKTYPGAEINSYHHPVTVKIHIKTKRPRNSVAKEQLKVRLLKEEDTKKSTILK